MIGRFALALLACLAAPAAHAHTLSVSHVDVALLDNGAATVEVDLALRDLALTFPLDANRDEMITWGELTALRPQVQQWVIDGIQMSSAGRDCALAPAEFGIRRYDDGTYATVQLLARCDGSDAVALRYSLLFDRDPQHRALVTVRHGNDATSAIARTGSDVIGLSTGAGTARESNPFVDYLHEGVHHILIGYDHLAFLVSLLLPAALIRMRGEWQPADSLRGSFLHVLGIVTAFTLAHSVTLTLSALGWIIPASRPVEVAIAASVLLAALNNLWPIVTGRIWMVGFAFGLIHGFGFAGALAELGLPTQSRLLALLGFNLGVELGQLVVVCLLLPILFALRRRRIYSHIAMPVASLAIAGLAAWWLLQRIAA